jgi:hypothetical protein
MQALGVLGPDGLPNTEKFQWKTIPQGAATYDEFSPPKKKLCLYFFVLARLPQHSIPA